MKTLSAASNEMTGVAPAHGRAVRGWQIWAPYAAVAWSLIYAALGVYWAMSGEGFPYASEPDLTGPLVGRLGQGVAWIVVILAGFPAAALGTAMLRGARKLRPVLVIAGALLAAALLLLMADLSLLTTLAYIPYVLFNLLTGGDIGPYLQMLSQGWRILAHQLLCLVGGFLWLATTVSYSRRSADACLYCGRRDGPEGWNSPQRAARWGRIAVYVALVAPILYAATRYAWAVGIPLGMTMDHWRWGQENGRWIAGLSLANVGLVGALLMLGLVQRWGEVFPRWMIGLAGRRVPIALAVVPASIMSVLLAVGGFTLMPGSGQMAGNAAAAGENFWVVVGPVLLFPFWGVALAVATLGYYYRRRGPCKMCGRGASGEIGKTIA